MDLTPPPRAEPPAGAADLKSAALAAMAASAAATDAAALLEAARAAPLAEEPEVAEVFFRRGRDLLGAGPDGAPRVASEAAARAAVEVCAVRAERAGRLREAASYFLAAARWADGAPGMGGLAAGVRLRMMFALDALCEFAELEAAADAVLAWRDADGTPARGTSLALAGLYKGVVLRHRGAAAEGTGAILGAGDAIRLDGVELPYSGFADTFAPIKLLSFDSRLEAIASITRLAHAPGADPVAVATAMSLVGRSLRMRARGKAALTSVYLTASVALFRRAGGKGTLLCGLALLEYGLVLKGEKRLEQAQKTLRRSYEYQRLSGIPPERLAWTTVSLAHVYADMDNHGGALGAAAGALRECGDTDKQLRSSAMMAHANARLLLGDVDDALAEYDEIDALVKSTPESLRDGWGAQVTNATANMRKTALSVQIARGRRSLK